jgi:hypothetical protein
MSGFPILCSGLRYCTIFASGAGTIVKTEHGSGMFLIVRALAIKRALCAGFSILLCAIPELGLITGSQCARVIRAVLTIVHALPLSGSYTVVLPSKSCCQNGCRNKDECENRTDYEFSDHG